MINTFEIDIPRESNTSRSVTIKFDWASWTWEMRFKAIWMIIIGATMEVRSGQFCEFKYGSGK